jgi:DNA-3-methyladenine glycosylase
VVTNYREVPHAVLIRALEPIEGVETMLKRTGKKKPDHTLTRGPGNLSKALGIYTQHSGISLQSKELFITDDDFVFKKNQIAASPRIGVDYAGDHSLWPYRFFVKDNPFVSGKLK